MGGRFHPVDGESLGGCLIAERVGGRAGKAERSAYTLLRGWEDESGDWEGVSACGRRLGPRYGPEKILDSSKFRGEELYLISTVLTHKRLTTSMKPSGDALVPHPHSAPISGYSGIT